MEKESIGDWDQFAANARFGGKSDYHEEIYTTAIDRSGPLYRMREIEAERKVREIEGDTAINPHIREERGLEVNDGDDEESRFVSP
jgi:PAB1-binding protein PBP1